MSMATVTTSHGYDLWFETNGERERPGVVLLHGFTGSLTNWGELLGSLSEDYFVVTPDLPGHGRSGESTEAEEMSLEATCDGLVNILDELGVRKVALLGYSLGGRVALTFGCTHQDRLSCLILESTSPGIRDAAERERRRLEDDRLAADIRERGVPWFVKHWEDLPLFATQKELPAETFQRIRDQRLSNRASGLSMSLSGAGTGRMSPLWSSLGGVKVPVLLLAGSRDERYVEASKAMKEMIPRSTLRVLDGAGHCTHVERPATFAQAVVHFLSEHARGDGDE